MNKGKLFFVIGLLFFASNLKAECPSEINYQAFMDVVKTILVEKEMLIEIESQPAIWEFGVTSWEDPEHYKLVFKYGWVPYTTAIVDLRNLAQRWSNENWSKETLMSHLGVADFLYFQLEDNWIDLETAKKIDMNAINTNTVFKTSQNLTVYFYALERVIDPCDLSDRIELGEEKLNPFKLAIDEPFAVIYPTISNQLDLNFKSINDKIDSHQYLDSSYFEIKDPHLSEFDFGKGLFALKPIEAGEVIGPYLGEVGPVFSETAYLMNALHYTIDASRAGNHTRYINHGPMTNANTAIVLVKTTDQLIEPYLISIKSIKPGQELLFDYGYDNFDGINFYPLTPDTRVKKN